MSSTSNSELPDSWTSTRLENVVERCRGREDPQEYPDLPYIGLKHIEEETMGLLGKSRSEEYQSTSVHFFPGDILYGRLRPYLNKVHLTDFEGLGSGEIIVLTPTEDIYSRYLAYLLNSQEFVRYANHRSTGDRPRVNYNKIKEFEVPVPPFAEQKSIVDKIEELLSKLDSGVKDLRTANKRLEQYKRIILQNSVEGEVTKYWRSNQEDIESTVQLLQRTEEKRENECGGKYGKLVEPTDIPDAIELPESWAWASLSQIGEVSRGKSTHRPRDDPSLFGGDYPFIQTGEVRAANTILNNYRRTYNEKGLEQSRLWPEGTLCITIAANIGETYLFSVVPS